MPCQVKIFNKRMCIDFINFTEIVLTYTFKYHMLTQLSIPPNCPFVVKVALK